MLSYTKITLKRYLKSPLISILSHLTIFLTSKDPNHAVILASPDVSVKEIDCLFKLGRSPTAFSHKHNAGCGGPQVPQNNGSWEEREKKRKDSWCQNTSLPFIRKCFISKQHVVQNNCWRISKVHYAVFKVYKYLHTKCSCWCQNHECFELIFKHDCCGNSAHTIWNVDF